MIGHGQCAGNDEKDVPTILRRLLATAHFSTSVNQPVDLSSGSGAAVGFKWRIWGEPERIAEVLREYDVIVFELLRFDITNLALSLYLTTHVLSRQQDHRFAKVLNDPNPQFRIRSLQRNDQQEVISFIRSIEFSVDIDRLTPIMMEYVASRQRIRRQYVNLFRRYGLDVHTMFYEDFLTNPIDFLSRMGALIGVMIDPGQKPFYPKVSRNDIRTQITNLSELEANRDVQRIKLAYYNSLINRFEPAQADAHAAPTAPMSASRSLSE